MANTVLDDPRFLAGAQQANQPGGVERAADLGAQVTQLATDDVYYPVGTKSLVQKMQGSETYKKALNSEWAQKARASDASAKFTKGGAAVDNFFVRMKDGAVAKAKSAYYSVRKFVTGKEAPVTADAGAAAAGEGALVADASKAGVAATDMAAGLETKAPGLLGKAWGTLGKVGQKVAIPLTLAVGAFQTHRAAKAGDGHGAAKASGGTIGGIVGGLAAGAAEGAIAGIVLGTAAFPVVGSIALGIGGAIVGGWIGSKTADKTVGKQWQAHLDRNKAVDQMMAQKTLGRSAQPGMEEAYYAQNGEGLAKNHFSSRVQAEQQAAITSGQSMVHG